jgi:serpin B
VLVNAVYFKGKWASPFTRAMTGDAEFTLSGGTKTKVQMMCFSGTRDLEYGETEDFQALRLPYNGGLDMLVALPRAGMKLADAQKKMTTGGLEALRGSLERQKVKAFLPKFSFTSGFELNEALASLGMPTAFTTAADFSGMDGTRNLYIQHAVHKAFVEVNEEGTEAAAATGISMGMKSMRLDFALFRADRPFFFFIEEPKSGLILFMGRVEDPARN